MIKTTKTSTSLSYIYLTLGLIFVLYPFILMVLNSFKPGPEIMHAPNALPSRLTLSGYIGVFRDLNILNLFKNSFIIAISIMLLNVFLDSMAAFAISKIRFPGSELLFRFMLMTMMIPGVLFFIPTYTMLYRWGWVNHFRSLIIPGAVGVYNIFLIKQFMEHIPDQLIEAARIDGASYPEIYLNIMLPMSRPVLATVAILTFMGSWNDLFGPLLYLRDQKKWTVQLGLHLFSGGVPGHKIEEVWAANVMITLPIIVIYFFLQKEFIKAFTDVDLK